MALKNEEGIREFSGYDRRKHPRYLVEIPMDCMTVESEDVCTGLTANASEGGIMTFIGERVDVGTTLNLALLFRMDFSLTSMESTCEVVWREDVWKEYVDNYRYGLRFVDMESGELEKLRTLLRGSERQETLYIPAGRRVH
jgi:hypothetical protein